MITQKMTWLLVGLLWLALWPGAARGQSPELQEGDAIHAPVALPAPW